MAQVDKKFILEMQGKPFITFDGLLDMAHQMGMVSLETEMISTDPYIFKAVVKTEAQTFTGHGDAAPDNVNRMIKPHMIRMAETRAKARALRDLTNVGMCSVEELGGDDTPQAPPKHTPSEQPEPAKTVRGNGNTSNDWENITDEEMEKEVKETSCEKCTTSMTSGQITISKKKFDGHLYCPACQKEVK